MKIKKSPAPGSSGTGLFCSKRSGRAAGRFELDRLLDRRQLQIDGYAHAFKTHDDTNDLIVIGQGPGRSFRRQLHFQGIGMLVVFHVDMELIKSKNSYLLQLHKVVI